MTEPLDAILRRYVGTDQSIPGAVLHVSRDEQVTYFKAFGVRHREKALAMTHTTLFDLASLTKVIATMPIALKLVECGIWDLDDPVARYLPEHVALHPGITLKHLLTHTSGYPARADLHFHCADASEFLRAIARTPLVFPPGTQRIYSCLNYHLVSFAAEAITKTPFRDLFRHFVQRIVGRPSLDFLPSFQEECAATEWCDWRKRLIWGEVHDENCAFLGGVSGNAGLFGTAEDVAAFLQAWKRNDIVSPLTRKYSETAQWPGQALGWWCQPAFAGDIIGPTGWGHTGFTGVSAFYNETTTVVLLTNRVHPVRHDVQSIEALRRRIHNAVGAQADVNSSEP